jgi:hypothetical protein
MAGSDESNPVYCRDCVTNLGIRSAFCSPECYDSSFQKHREAIHLPEYGRQNRSTADDAKDLEYAAEDRSRYRARRIEDHFITQDDAFRAYQQKTGAVVR